MKIDFIHNILAYAYIILMSQDFDHLIHDPDNASDTNVMMSYPKPSGEREYMVITILESNTTYYVAIRSMDEMNNKGEVSNIVSCSVISDPEWISKPPDHMTTGPDDVRGSQQPSASVTVVVAICIPVGLICLVIIIIVVVLWKRRRGLFNVNKGMTPVPTAEPV